MSENKIISNPSDAQQERKMRVIIALPGDHFSQSFLMSWTETLHILIASKRYEIVISPGKSSFVTFARMQTLGLNVLRGKNQKPFNGENYDIYVSLDSDVVFSASQLIELIETTKLHPVVSGYYMMNDNKHLSVVKEWDTDYFAKNGSFQFMVPKDTEADMIEFANEINSRKAEDRDKPISEPKFKKVSYVGLGFFACRKEVLDKLQYPYFNSELEHIKGANGVDIVEVCSEDVSFCKHIQGVGYDIMLNTRLRVGHEKSVIL
jgi:hypothetical protein